MESAGIYQRIEESRRELLDLSLRNPLLSYRPLQAKGVEIVGESATQIFDALVTKGLAMSFLPGRQEDAAEATDSAVPYPWLRGANQSDRSLQTGEPRINLQKRLLNTFREANTSVEETGVNTLFLALGMFRWYEADSREQARLAPLILVPVRLERGSARERFVVQYTDDDLGVNLSFIEKARADFGLTLPGQDALESEDGEINFAGYIDQATGVIGKSAPDRWRVEPDRIALGFFSFNKLLMYRDLEDPAVAENEVISALFGDGFREPPSAIGDNERLDSRLAPRDTYHVLDADSSQSLAIYDANDRRSLVIQGPPGTGKSQTITNIIAAAVGRGQRALFVSEKMAALEVVKRRLDSIGLGDPCLELHSHKTNKRQTLDELKRILEAQETGNNGSNSDQGLHNLEEIRNQLNDYSEAVNTPIGSSGVTPQDAFGRLLAPGGKRTDNPFRRADLVDVGEWTGDDFRRKRDVVDELRQRLQRSGVPAQHLFWGSGLRALLPSDQAELRDKLTKTLDALETLVASVSLPDAKGLEIPASIDGAAALLHSAEQAVAAPDLSGLNLSTPQWVRNSVEIETLLEQAARWGQLRREHDAILTPQAWDADLGQVRQYLDTAGRKLFGRLFSSDYKQAKRKLASLLSGPLPKGIDSQIALIDAVLKERQFRKAINEDYPDAELALGSHWKGDGSDWPAITPIARWWLNRLKDSAEERFPSRALQLLRAASASPDGEGWHTGRLREGVATLSCALEDYRAAVREVEAALALDNPARFGSPRGLLALDFTEQRGTLAEWADRLPDIQDIISVNNGVDHLLAENLRPVADLAARSPDAVQSLTAWFDWVWYENIVQAAFEQRPALQGFDGRVHEGRIERFRTLDLQSLELNRYRVAEAHREVAARLTELPSRLSRSGTVEDETRKRQQQLRVLRREIEKKSRHKPIRQLITEAGDVIQELKPVFMMSPLSIAKYLKPNSMKFDLVVFDEASQVRPVDSLGALLRGDKAVVVGDSKQMPPSSFFDRISHGDEEVDSESVTADVESILGLFTSQGAPSRQLSWHYRSRHESLIAVSNREFYDNSLVVFPSPDAGQETVGLHYHHLPEAVYDRGRSRTNPKEAMAVARAVMEHAAHSPELSLGVAAFSQAQAIADRLETLRQQDDSVEGFFNAHPEEPFFVKNLENVQGDERDVIFISVGYGRDENRQVYQNFGPLNQMGGERRLNVLITRAKMRCHVYTNLNAADISVSDALGMQALRTFLAYAETGIMPDIPSERGREAGSPFQQAVAARLEERGYRVNEVASGGKFVDIGIVDPQREGRYIIGIECDGASYHNSRSARDRDRLREQVLRGLGWKLHRVWSADWFRDSERELERAIAAIEQAKSGL